MKVGDRVNRIEDREVTGGTVLEVVPLGDDEISIHISYDEGGDGWWPIHCLELIETETETKND
jgi:hypothetical protein